MSLMTISVIATTIRFSLLMTLRLTQGRLQTLSAQNVLIHHKDVDVSLTLLP